VTAPRARFEDLVVDRWGARFRGRRMPCALGRGGVSAAKREGDGASPAGALRLRRVLWRRDRLARPAARALPGAPIGPRDGWSDDPRDPAYNRAVRLPSRFSAERMRRGDRLYDIVVETDWNADCAPGAGSAIFLHLWRAPRRPTAGCVAFRRRDLAFVLACWTPRGRVLIRGG
jgi:L,D-peptidoglycan transpeptidase YkuD (ErfK/YbiS/YcfS/YnhG family)